MDETGDELGKHGEGEAEDVEEGERHERLLSVENILFRRQDVHRERRQ